MKNFILILIILMSCHTTAQKKTTVSTNTKISVSVNDTDHTYTYSARFNKEKTEEVKNTIQNVLGNATEKTERTSIWEGKEYSVSLRSGKVEIEFQKDSTLKALKLKLEDLGEQISEVLDAPKTPRPPKTPKTN